MVQNFCISSKRTSKYGLRVALHLNHCVAELSILALLICLFIYALNNREIVCVFGVNGCTLTGPCKVLPRGNVWQH